MGDGGPTRLQLPFLTWSAATMLPPAGVQQRSSPLLSILITLSLLLITNASADGDVWHADITEQALSPPLDLVDDDGYQHVDDDDLHFGNFADKGPWSPYEEEESMRGNRVNKFSQATLHIGKYRSAAYSKDPTEAQGQFEAAVNAGNFEEAAAAATKEVRDLGYHPKKEGVIRLLHHADDTSKHQHHKTKKVNFDKYFTKGDGIHIKFKSKKFKHQWYRPKKKKKKIQKKAPLAHSAADADFAAAAAGAPAPKEGTQWDMDNKLGYKEDQHQAAEGKKALKKQVKKSEGKATTMVKKIMKRAPDSPRNLAKKVAKAGVTPKQEAKVVNHLVKQSPLKAIKVAAKNDKKAVIDVPKPIKKVVFKPVKIPKPHPAMKKEMQAPNKGHMQVIKAPEPPAPLKKKKVV